MLYVTQVEMWPPLLLAYANVLGMKSKQIIYLHILKLKHLLRVLGTSASLFIIHSLDQFVKDS